MKYLLVLVFLSSYAIASGSGLEIEPPPAPIVYLPATSRLEKLVVLKCFSNAFVRGCQWIPPNASEPVPVDHKKTGSNLRPYYFRDLNFSRTGGNGCGIEIREFSAKYAGRWTCEVTDIYKISTTFQVDAPLWTVLNTQNLPSNEKLQFKDKAIHPRSWVINADFKRISEPITRFLGNALCWTFVSTVGLVILGLIALKLQKCFEVDNNNDERFENLHTIRINE